MIAGLSKRAHTGITPCRLVWALDALGRRHLERADHGRARLARVDHVVDQGVAGGDVRVDRLADPLDHLRPRGVRVVGSLDLLAEDDVHRALGPHHRDLGTRPGHDQVGLVGLAAHHVVARAVGLPHDDGHLRHGGARDGVEHLRAVPDDPGVLDLRADHEAGHVHQEEQRDAVGVAEVDEARRLVGGVVLEDAAEVTRLVGHDPHRAAAHPGEAGDDRARPARLEVEPLPVVHDPADHVVHVVRVARGVGQHVEQLLVLAVHRVGRLGERRRLFAVLRHVGQVVPDRLDAALVRVDLEVAHA